MSENLVIVESPAKAKTIEKFLGKDFQVASSMGHIRDLEKKDFGIDIENDFLPKYIISPDKKKIVADLKKLVKETNLIWLASDEDREGEAIAWHLSEVLNLDPGKTRRIVFHEITKDAIINAISNPRSVDMNLVNAQQARRVLDRIVGFEISPVLWRKVKPALSAGRVQSVAVRLIVEKEREINNFVSNSYFKVSGVFHVKHESGISAKFTAELNRRFKNSEEAYAFLEKCKNAEFNVVEVNKKPGKRSPAQPFTTSTLQQEASRKLNYSVSRTMTIAQQLYEKGFITYMRTDSVSLSSLALNTLKKKIIELHGEKYSQPRQYKTKSKGAQEAHEAIRPSYADQESITGTSQEQKLYELIWKRTVASQMADTLLEKTTITIDISTSTDKFIASGEVILFDGFLKVYTESSEEDALPGNGKKEEILPPLKVNEALSAVSIDATERFTSKPTRYTEASLVKQLEDLGIGRPSTYAPTISTIQNREYVIKEDRPGTERSYTVLSLKEDKISSSVKNETTGYEKAKLFPTDIGIVVNDFLIKHFSQIVDYNFTANVEKEFDDIAEGKLIWNKMIDRFYKPFHDNVNSVLKVSDKSKGERILGNDPLTGKQVSVKIGRFGPIAQLGSSSGTETDSKPQFASLRPGQLLESITLEDALELFKLPREIGNYESKTVSVGIGRFGPYLKHNNEFISLGKNDDPYSITLERSIELIKNKKEKVSKSIIKTFSENPDIKILNGRWGPYISYKKKNFRIHKGIKAEDLTYSDCLKIIGGPVEEKKRTKKK